MPNTPLLRRIMEHVTAHPDEHDQSSWGYRDGCGTTRCIAGWAVELSDAEPLWRAPLRFGQFRGGARMADGRMLDVQDAAAELLGLTHAQALDLFEAWDIDEVWGVVKDITDGELTRESIAPRVET